MTLGNRKSKVKRNAKGEIERFKARLVEYNAHVLCLEPIGLKVSLAAQYKW